jgi:glycosyltransferase involved in cell wall biosynthesis
MPPKIIFWTGAWDPKMEAHSVEIELLRSSLENRSWVVSLSSQQLRVSLSARLIQLPSRLWWAYRGIQIAVERLGDVMHAFGPLDAWHLTRSLRTRPLLFTVTIPGRPAEPLLSGRVSCFVAESEYIRELLLSEGIAPDRVRLIYPGVDLARFVPHPFPSRGPFRLLFASSPASVDEYEDRGIHLLVELARRLPDIEILCPWRTWDSLQQSSLELRKLCVPGNFVIWRQNIPDMSAIYRRVHATIIPFGAGFGKSCPNSCIEGLASGRPSLVSEYCGIADLVHQSGAGIKFKRDGAALEAAVLQLRASFQDYSVRARDLAEKAFGLEEFRGNYHALYAELRRDHPRNIARVRPRNQ